MKKAKLIKRSEVDAYLKKLETSPLPPPKKDTFTTARIAVAEKLSKRGSS